MLGCFSGFRISELLSLTVGDVVEHGRIVKTVSVRRSNMKGSRGGRSISLNPKAKKALEPWLAQLGDVLSSSPCFLLGRATRASAGLRRIESLRRRQR